MRSINCSYLALTSVVAIGVGGCVSTGPRTVAGAVDGAVIGGVLTGAGKGLARGAVIGAVGGMVLDSLEEADRGDYPEYYYEPEVDRPRWYLPFPFLWVSEWHGRLYWNRGGGCR